MLVPFLTAAISMGVVYLYGAVGETLIEKGGSLNLGIPGIMCLGALGGVIGANIYGAIFGSNIIGVVLILFSIFFSILFCNAWSSWAEGNAVEGPHGKHTAGSLGKPGATGLILF